MVESDASGETDWFRPRVRHHRRMKTAVPLLGHAQRVGQARTQGPRLRGRHRWVKGRPGPAGAEPATELYNARHRSIILRPGSPDLVEAAHAYFPICGRHAVRKRRRCRRARAESYAGLSERAGGRHPHERPGRDVERVLQPGEHLRRAVGVGGEVGVHVVGRTADAVGSDAEEVAEVEPARSPSATAARWRCWCGSSRSGGRSRAPSRSRRPATRSPAGRWWRSGSVLSEALPVGLLSTSSRTTALSSRL